MAVLAERQRQHGSGAAMAGSVVAALAAQGRRWQRSNGIGGSGGGQQRGRVAAAAAAEQWRQQQHGDGRGRAATAVAVRWRRQQHGGGIGRLVEAARRPRQSGASQEQKEVLIEIYCIKKCLLDLDPI